MYVCLCHGFTDREVRAAIDEGKAGSTAAVYKHFDCKPRCGKCVPYVRGMLQNSQPSQSCGACGDDCDCFKTA